MNKRKWLMIILIPITLVLLYGTTYVPHILIKIDPNSVSKIVVFDGNNGERIEVTDTEDIQHIIRNLDGIFYQKGKPTFGYMGYSYRLTVYNNRGGTVKKFIINSADTIRYHGFFYKALNKQMDYDYIGQLYGKYPTIDP